MSLREVMSWNFHVLAQARDMNKRVGEKIFPEFDREEFRLWLKGKINGAKSLKVIPDLNELKLPELNEKEVAKIKKNNPDSIMLFGRKLDVDYSRFPKLTLDLHDLPDVDWHNLKEFDFSLPGGREYLIVLNRDGQYYDSVESFQELKKEVLDYLDYGRKEVLLSKARAKHAIVGIISRSKIFDLITKLLKSEIVIDNEVAGYLALSYNRHIPTEFMVLEEKEQAQFLTKESLEHLFEDEVRDSCQVPETSDFFDQGYYMKKLNTLGRNLKQCLDSLLEEYFEDLNASNIQKRIEDFEKQVCSIVSEYQENAGLYKAGLKNLDFESLINGKRVEELTSILVKVQRTLQYSEEQIVKAFYVLTKNGNGLLKKGNKLWLALKNDFPGKEYEVDTESLSWAIMEIVEN